MRLRVVIAVLGLGLVIVLGVWLLRPGRQEPTVPNPPSEVAGAPSVGLGRSPVPGVAKPGPAPVPRVAPPPGADTNASGMQSPEAREQAYVQERVAQLMDLAMDDQPASLEIILSELTNRDPDIRQAAVQAAMQFGSRDAIPKLQEAIDQTDDLHEKAALQDAIEFLQIPTPAKPTTPPVVAPAIQQLNKR